MSEVTVKELEDMIQPEEDDQEANSLPAREVRLPVEMEDRPGDESEHRQLAIGFVDGDTAESLLFLFRLDGCRGFFLEWSELKAALEYLRPLGLIETKIPPGKGHA